MAKISDLLTDEKKTLVVDSAIETGQVFRIKLTEDEEVKAKNKGEDGRNKYFIVLGFDDKKTIGAVLINTNINPNLSQKLKDLHYPLYVKNYSFLKYDSFVDCGSLKPIAKEKYESKLDSFVGEINKDDMELILKTVSQDAPIEIKKLKRFGLI
ncbi:MAG: hypothetical protein LBQ73_07605 [Tannerellaceae bacterium]|jgi:hypothetical protein|nr:hypothetical protein [Tannerellaceae bacterium]